MELDKEKIKKVNIKDLRLNPWNPKKDVSKNFDKVVKSIEIYGQDLPVVVRQNDGYEIIDGEQRYKAMLELGFTEILIYDRGEVSDKEAKSLTLFHQVQVPFDESQLAELVISFDDVTIDIPYLPVEVEAMKEVKNFSWDNYKHEELIQGGNKEITCPKCGEIIGQK